MVVNINITAANWKGTRTAPTAIVCVETAEEELEAVEATTGAVVVAMLEPDLVD